MTISHCQREIRRFFQKEIVIVGKALIVGIRGRFLYLSFENDIHESSCGKRE